MSLAAGHGSFAAYSDQVVTSTVTVGSIVSTSLSLPQRIFNGPFTVLSTTGTNLRCEFWTFTFTADAGQYVSGNFTSDNPVGFFVVQATSYHNWLEGGTCGNVGDAIASQLITTSYSFNAAIPTSGMWTIVLVNSSTAKNADGFLAAYLSSGSYTITQPLMGTMTSTITSPTATASGAGQSRTIEGFPFASIVVGVMFGLVAIVVLRRRGRS